MIRINLLGQPRPKSRRAALPLGSTLQLVSPILVILVALGILGVHYSALSRERDELRQEQERLRSEKAELEQLKQQVEQYERQKAVLQQHINVIEGLRRSKTGGQELLDMVANTVNRTESLWLTSLVREQNVLTIEGTAGSINAVANYITNLKRSGYFDKVEIKESRQDERNTAVETFQFVLTAEFVLPDAQQPAGRARSGSD